MPRTGRRSACAFCSARTGAGIHLLATPPDFLGPAISNVSIIEQSDGIVLIDSGATAADAGGSSLMSGR
jgi:hypothetical protein